VSLIVIQSSEKTQIWYQNPKKRDLTYAAGLERSEY
jgi:hypothetical protein